VTFEQALSLAITRITPEILVASLLVIASICFFAAALTVLLVLRVSVPSAVIADGAPSPAGAEPVAATADPSPVAASVRAVAPPATGASVAKERDFEHEIALAGQGCSAEQLMRECGLSQVEARLLVRLYGSNAA
jgi:hypothetical protein